ncbi:DegV family protein [Hathewaya histolytica]|uniref:DegV family protein n=1 Tax=Hathewaya histolytica TaxID=1498 RepID=A0A4U9QWU4_HATHI|nr:DegV family protein [Hathewaya histolytica]VTQ83226.1 degV family protein [Hathewaya histolytica]
MNDFVIITDSGCDLSLDIVKFLNIEYMGLVCDLNGKEIIEDCGASLSYKDFYRAIREGASPTTSQINSFRFYTEFEKHVKDNNKVLYIAFSSALSGTYNSAVMAREDILEKYPDADISIVDTRGASSGQGLLVYKAAKLREEGKSKEEIVKWLETNKNRVCHYFTVDDLKHLKRGGRISAVSANIGGLLNIKPVMYINDEGKLIPFYKARGHKQALKKLFENLEAHLSDDSLEEIFIAHSDNLKGAEELANMIKEKYNVKNIIINYIGLAIGSHTGVGTVALYFLGTHKEPK